ncbi:MAG: hypothetical protein ABIW32_08225 [Terrimesophilobacter sp.]
MTLTLRWGLALLAFAEFVIGGWNLFAPEHFYANFPGVNLSPPFAEHYARDFGGATIGIGIVLAAAALFPRTVLVIPALLAICAFTLPHAWFHLAHLHGASTEILVFTIVAVVGEAALSLALLALAIVRWRSGMAQRDGAERPRSVR